MIKIQLTVKRPDGDRAHVAYLAIPPFQSGPEVIIWGNRTFTRDFLQPGPYPRYVEAFAYMHPVQDALPEGFGS